MDRPRWQNLFVLVLPLLVAGGCIAIPSKPPEAVHKLADGATYMLHLPGVSGMLVVDGWLVDGLHDGGAADVVEVFDWVGPGGPVERLQDVERNRKTAGKISKFVSDVRRENPNSRIVLCAESGGVAVALWLLESLPPDVAVDDLLMVSPAVSKDYDLTGALAHVRNHAYYTTTPLDVDTLGVFTTMLGNADGVKGVGAGWVGFETPGGKSGTAYRKLVRISYEAQWVVYGNFGTHTGPMSYEFARNVLAPRLIADRSRTGPRPRLPSPPQNSVVRLQ